MAAPEEVVTLRPAGARDAPVVAEICQHGRRDGHLGHVPDGPIRVPARRHVEHVGAPERD